VVSVDHHANTVVFHEESGGGESGRVHGSDAGQPQPEGHNHHGNRVSTTFSAIQEIALSGEQLLADGEKCPGHHGAYPIVVVAQGPI
jgi:hypothetical protein